MSFCVDARLKWLAGIVAVVVGLPVLFVYALYWYGAWDLPKQLPHASHEYPAELRRLYWRVEQRGDGEPAIRQYGPVGVAWTLLSMRAGAREWNPSLSLPGQAARLVDAAASRNQGQRHLRNAALAIRLGKERTTAELIDLVLDRSYFAGGVHGLDAAAQANYGVPAQALTREEALALIVTMKSPSVFSPHCRSSFEARYLWAVQQHGLPATGALAAARRRLRPLPCHS